jgi:hypothetical protein
MVAGAALFAPSEWWLSVRSATVFGTVWKKLRLRNATQSQK